MTKQEKIKVILDAVENKEVSANQLDTTKGKGKTISKMKNGNNVQESTVDGIYNNLLSIRATKRQSITPSITPTGKDKSMEERMATLERENQELRAKLADMERKIASITAINNTVHNSVNNVSITKKSQSVMGFTVSSDAKGRYSCVKRIDGKLNCVYVGRDLSLAESKIRTYCLNHNIKLEVSK